MMMMMLMMMRVDVVVALLLLFAGGGALAPLTPVARLRLLLDSGTLSLMPCVYDGITARLVEEAGFDVTFMSGFSVAASRGFPDVQLVSAGEMQDSARVVVSALKKGTPCIADGDTGYGNAVNVGRTVRGLAQVGMAGVMIEDQVAPKRCGHTRVKAVVDMAEACRRVRAACDARDDLRLTTGGDVVIVARTDANACLGFEEAMRRCRAFRALGADVTFLEAPKTEAEMRAYCAGVEGPKLANMLEGGATPILSPADLEDIGYALAAYPLSLLSASTRAMRATLSKLQTNEALSTETDILPFAELCDAVGFPEYWAQEAKYEHEEEEEEEEEEEAKL